MRRSDLQKYIDAVIFLLIAVILFTVFIPLFHYYSEKPTLDNYHLVPDADSAYRNALEDSLPYKSIKQKIDSIRSMTQLYTNRFWGESGYLPAIGISKSEGCDTCMYAGDLRHGLASQNTSRYYLALVDYALPDDIVSSVHQPVFFQSKGKFYKKYLVADSAKKDGFMEYELHWHTKQMEYGVDRFTIDPTENQAALVNIMIPVSRTVYQVLYCFWFVYLLVGLIILSGFIVRPFIFFIMNLAKGQAFIWKNYVHLLYMVYALIGIPVFNFVTKYMVYLFFRKYVAGNFVFISTGINMRNSFLPD